MNSGVFGSSQGVHQRQALCLCHHLFGNQVTLGKSLSGFHLLAVHEPLPQAGWASFRASSHAGFKKGSCPLLSPCGGLLPQLCDCPGASWKSGLTAPTFSKGIAMSPGSPGKGHQPTAFSKSPSRPDRRARFLLCPFLLAWGSSHQPQDTVPSRAGKGFHCVSLSLFTLPAMGSSLPDS